MSMQPEPTTIADDATPSVRVGAPLTRLIRLQALPVLTATILLFLVAAVVAPRIFTSASMVAIVIPASVLAIAGIGQTLVIQQKGIDLSVPGMMTLSAVLTAVLTANGVPFVVGLLVGIGVGVLGGIVNAFIVTRLHITPLLVTLATNYLFIGLVWTTSGGAARNAPNELVGIAGASWLGFPVIGWIAIVLLVVVAVVMSATSFGRRFTGAGASPLAARAAGTLIDRHIALGYIASSVAASLAGLLLAGYAGQVTYDIGTPYQLTVIAAVVVGGAALAGGRGSVIATGLGALLLTVVVQMILTLGAPQSVQLLAQAVVFGLAAMARLLPWGRVRRARTT